MKNERPTSKEPIIHTDDKINALSALGKSLIIHEWTGSGAPYMHVHHEDDEAWHVLEGELTFKFVDKNVVVSKGATVFIPAGVAHTYFEDNGPSRYLMILTPRLNELIAALHNSKLDMHAKIMRKYKSEIL